VLLVVSTVGCASCSEHPDARLALRATLPGRLDITMLRVVATDGIQSWSFTDTDFRALNAVQFEGPQVATATRGTLAVRYTLVMPNGTIASEGQVTLDLRSDWGWSVSIHGDTLDPRARCFGCLGSRAFALAEPYRSTAADSVYIVWSGNSIGKYVVY
jgi:hypothetical protein